jgi:hypothetical protein
MEPATRVGLNLGDAEKFMKLIERLEDLDDTLMGSLCGFLDTLPHWFLSEYVNRGFAQFVGDISPPPVPIHARHKSCLCAPKFRL